MGDDLVYIKKSRHKFANGSVKTQITLAESYRPGKGLPSKTRVLRDYGYLEDKADQAKFLLELQTMVEQSRKENQPFELFIDTNRKINDPANRDMNYGVLILRKLYEQLHIPEFIKAHRNSRAKYDLNEILCYLTCMKIIFPDSKRATYMNSKHIFGMDISFNLQDVYAALTEICALRFQLQRHLQRELSRLLKADKSYVYLDVTNTYMEVDFAREGALGQRGVSKDHRTEPIVQMGLLLDSNGMPLLHECFPGNTSDSLILQPMVEQVRKEGMTAERIIVVADKGLNSGKNIDYLCNDGNGYVFSQILKGKKGSLYQKRMLDESRYTVNADGSYKWQLFEEDYDGFDSDGKKVTRKRKVLIYWSKAEAEVAFQLYLDGRNATQISEEMKKRGYDAPGDYLAKRNQYTKGKAVTFETPTAIWHPGTILNILDRYEYCGHTVTSFAIHCPPSLWNGCVVE